MISHPCEAIFGARLPCGHDVSKTLYITITKMKLTESAQQVFDVLLPFWNMSWLPSLKHISLFLLRCFINWPCWECRSLIFFTTSSLCHTGSHDLFQKEIAHHILTGHFQILSVSFCMVMYKVFHDIATTKASNRYRFTGMTDQPDLIFTLSWWFGHLAAH